MKDRYIISPHAQGTPEWKQDRCGKATGSRASDIRAKIKSGEAAARRNYRMQIVLERITGQPTPDGFISAEMEWGMAQEPFARMAYESKSGFMVQEAGFAYLPTLPVGCSVDGFIEDGKRKGLAEFKCPLPATHLKYLDGNCLPPEYEPQVLHNMWITDAEFTDFVSFDPRFPEKLQLFHIRVERDEKAIKVYEAECMLFLSECAGMEEQLRRRAA